MSIVSGSATSSSSDFIESVVAVLHQLGDAIGSLENHQYTQRPIGVIDASIGSHVRHCLDHVQSLIDAAHTGQLDYDRRQRDTPVETDRQIAVDLIAKLVMQLRQLPDHAHAQTLRLSVLMTADGTCLATTTRFDRELAFVLSHTIHHNALILAMLKTLGTTPPPRFGYAPTTVRHQNSLESHACAPSV
jgi:uncharacterized damage-inducible protein DinB